jgi:serine/threonine protein kinase
VHVDLEKTVAIKVLRPEALQSADTRRRFLREARTAANLRHPNVAEVFDVGEEDATLFLVMEYLEGETLLRALLYRARGASPPSSACVDLLLPVCGALAVAHEHRASCTAT